MIYYPFWGMSAVWWVFWLVALVMLFGVAVPIPRGRWREYKQASPLAILQRRYALGEVTTEQYEERKAILERDRTDGFTQRPSPMSTTPRGV